MYLTIPLTISLKCQYLYINIRTIHPGMSRPGGCVGGCHTPKLCCPAIFQVKLTHIQVKFKSGRGIVEREIENAKSKEVMTMLFDVAKLLLGID